MNRSVRIVLTTVISIAAICAFLLVMPSLIGALMGILLVFAIVDYSSRRYRNHVRTFNSAVRSVCQHEGAIGKVALAFSRTGPLSGTCYEYTRRLMMGEGPIDAAVHARVPLQLQTAIAIETPTHAYDTERDQDVAETELENVDSTMMPVYGQFVYLIGATIVTVLVLSFLSVFIVPTMEQMFEEFGMDFVFEWAFSTAPVVSMLLFLAVVTMGVIPILNGMVGMRLPRLIPMLPRRAERKSEFLRGLADGFELGWPVGRTLAIAHAVARHPMDRHSLERIMRRVQDGMDPIESIRRGGWLDRREAAWIDQSNGPRSAQILRTIADQNVRDGTANLRWIMAIFYPVLIVMLGMTVALIVVGFFGTLVELISALS